MCGAEVASAAQDMGRCEETWAMLALTMARRRAAPGSHKPTGAVSMVEVAGSSWDAHGTAWCWGRSDMQ